MRGVHTAAPRMSKPVFVTQPFLPPLDELLPYLEQIWASKTITNNGPFHKQLERALCQHLGVEHISLFSNGTIALITALKALRITGEVITTPYSFVATAHALLWNNVTPVFVDIDPETLNLDPTKIEAAITPATTAILPVHCYGTPCDVDAIKMVADNYNLKIIYDAAHAFGVDYRGRSLLDHGDLSVLSFHATKVFNTFEGGAIVSPDAKTKQHVDRLKNFGFVDETTVVATGINGKMSEFNAALGLVQLRHIDEALARRREIDRYFRAELRSVAGITCLEPAAHSDSNHGYFPILIGDDYPVGRDALYEHLREHGVFARRYFYPLITEFPMYRGLPSADSSHLPVALDTAQRVICLPIYPALSQADQARIVDLLRDPDRSRPELVITTPAAGRIS
jgi:dTDP-4-amino-4,6-dideoxygalactose transaminase